MKAIFLFVFVCNSLITYAQNINQLKVNVSAHESGRKRILTANVADGSGDYTYSWTCSATYGIPTDRSAKQVTIPLDKDDITYEVYVRDNKTKLLGYRTINFSKPKSQVKVRTYPNPSQDVITIDLQNEKQTGLDEKQKITKLELLSEKTGRVVKTVPLAGKSLDEIKINVKDLPKGVYYIHLSLNDDVHVEEQKEIVRVVLGN